MKELKMFPQIREETEEENLLTLEEEEEEETKYESKSAPLSSASSTESPPPPSPSREEAPLLTVTPDDSTPPQHPSDPAPVSPRSPTPDEECSNGGPRRVRMRSLSGGAYRLSAQPPPNVPSARMRRQSGDDVLSPSKRNNLFDFRPRSKSDSKGKRPTFLSNLRNSLFSNSGGHQRKTSLEEPPGLDPLQQPDIRQRSRSGSETRGGTMSKMIDLFRNRSNSLTAESRIKDFSASNILLRRRSLEPTKITKRKPYNAYKSFESQQRESYACHSEEETIFRVDVSKLDEDKVIPTYLSSRPCYAVMPTSGKVVVLSVDLLVKNAFNALVTNDIKAAPLWDSIENFVGMLTISDFINVLRHYYYTNPDDIKDIENQTIATWRRITQVEKPVVKINGMESLSLAAELLIEQGVHRIPVFDEKRQCVLFVLTRKRLLHYLHYTLFEPFDKQNFKPSFFRKTIRELEVGTFGDIATVTEDARVIEALDLFVKRNVSSLPVVNGNGVLEDIFEKFDVFALAKEQTYHNLDMTVSEAIEKGNAKNSARFHEDVIICTLDETLATVINRFVTKNVHRIVVIDENRRVVGMISLSDVLKFLVIKPLSKFLRKDPHWRLQLWYEEQIQKNNADKSDVSSIIHEGTEGAAGGSEAEDTEKSLAEDISKLQVTEPPAEE